MVKILNSSQEVESQLKVLRDESFPEGESSQFLNLVWEKIEASKPIPQFSFAPAYAAAICVLILVYGLWMYQKSVVIPAKAGIHAARTGTVVAGLSGVILETDKGITSGEENMIETKDRLATDQDSWITFYFPGAGHFRLAGNSVLTVVEAKNKSIQFFLERGKLYSRLQRLERDSSVKYQTPYGAARVLGTDFLLDVKKDSGMTVDVLDGTVGLEAEGLSDMRSKVEKGSRALISPYSEGTILVTQLKPEQQNQLEEEFEQMFSLVAASKSGEKESARALRIVSREED